MHASIQEEFKHAIPPQPTIGVSRPPFPRKYPTDFDNERGADASNVERETSNCRINITFRFYRPDFIPMTTPRCKCGQPCILRPDMKGRSDQSSVSSGSEGGDALSEDQIRYWWTCYAGAQDGKKGCGMWKVMDMKAEGRGRVLEMQSRISDMARDIDALLISQFDFDFVSTAYQISNV